MGSDHAIHPAIGGCGGVYFLAEPGELAVEVEKRDRNLRGARSELRAILVGPDRRVVQEATIPDDGQPRGSGLGPPQRVRLSARVERKGVYALNVTVSNDRYGVEMVWGFRTNCPKYLIETARGHKDERHQEPIVLLSPDRPSDVCFLPRPAEFAMEVTGLPGGVEELSVSDAKGATIATLNVDAKGRAAHRFPADAHRDAVPWRLHLPKAQATIHIDGVTRWDRGDLCENVCCWTPDPASWFPFLEHRWLLTPYSRTAYGEPGRSGQVVLRVHSNARGAKTVQLSMEFPSGEWPAKLSPERLVLRPDTGADVTVGYTVPAEGETRVCHVRATPADSPDFSTYSTLIVKGGVAPATRPLAMPLVLKPYQHENEQFGHLPDYPVESQPYFDLKNQPFVRVGNGVATCRDGRWATSDLAAAVRTRVPPFEGASFGTPSTKLAFDRDNGLYLVATAGGQAVLLHSTDGAQTFSAYGIPGREGQPRSFEIEQSSGHNVPDGPPPILRYTLTAKDPRVFWRRVNDLELFLPRRENGRLVIGEPVLVSKQCIGLAAHSGIPASIVSRGSKVHVIWGEATDPNEKVPGVPTFVATCDRETGKLGEPALVGYGAPPNDVHNSPSITMDSQGYLHALAGTHGRPFQYARSLKPNDAHSGWTKAEPVGGNSPQTYIGMVCGRDDTLHLAYRLWRSGVEPFPASHHATLAYQRKRPGQPWEPPKVLVVAAFSEYSVYYHRLTVDRAGRLFLSYDYWSTYWFYRNDHFGRRRAVIMSPDGGDSWKLVQTNDLRLPAP
ncbi:MAG TPA: BNR-4 repeat-containing protein [Planctomycetota bacterium]|nr:BNR-4 repeat-containing protein [Planctomycetota bacterium]